MAENTSPSRPEGVPPEAGAGAPAAPAAPGAAPAAAEAPAGPVAPAGPDGGPAAPPRLAPWLLLYTLGRLAIAAALVALLWFAGLKSYAGLLFGVLLSMPVSYLALRPVRDRLTEAIAARSVARRAEKEDLRARLSGSDGEEPA